ncbi:hypothetical protein BVRB_8g194240 [Beta vulgaris subsp. vulgaris]|nr:hypothetical protein BVRB_8g194240 [Beta vulgaris subsp. vulgaris]
MTFPTYIFLLLFLCSTISSHTIKPSYKKPISFSTTVYNRHRYHHQQPSPETSKQRHVDVHSSIYRIVVMAVGLGSNSTSTPMLMTELAVDTGSSFTWIQSFPCDSCYSQGNFPYYNHTASKSFNYVYCGDEICETLHGDVYPGCRALRGSLEEFSCSYRMRYLDQSSSSGIVGTETFYFPKQRPILDEYMPLDGVPFGVGVSNNIPDNLVGFAPGMAGLLREGTLLNKLGVKRFSHCFPRFEDDIGLIGFGEEANITGVKLALNQESTNYEAPLTNVFVAGEQILVAEEGLPVDMVFDTGTSWSVLSSPLMDAFMVAINRTSLRKFRPQRLNGRSEFCYKTTDLLTIDLDKVAKVTFQFRYTANIDLFSFHIWTRVDEFLCLAFMRGEQGENVFGSDLMRHMNIGYTLDIDDFAMYFSHEHCWI